MGKSVRRRWREKSGASEKLSHKSARGGIDLNHPHFFSYPRPVSAFFISPVCFFTARSHRTSKTGAGQRISGVKEENSTGILSLSPPLPLPLSVLLFSTGFVGFADRRLSAKTRSMKRTLIGSNAELGSL